MSNNDLDFKMLQTFQALIENGQVSAAADALGVGQSNVSRSLAKLRTHFGDPLFVRTQKGMEPTPRAVQIAKSVERGAQTPSGSPKSNELANRECRRKVGEDRDNGDARANYRNQGGDERSGGFSTP